MTNKCKSTRKLTKHLHLKCSKEIEDIQLKQNHHRSSKLEYGFELQNFRHVQKYF